MDAIISTLLDAPRHDSKPKFGLLRLDRGHVLAGPSERLASAAPQSGRRWFGEWQLWALAAFAIACYDSRLTALPIHGEETRRAQVAIEMVRGGDWIVPRQQGVPLLSRPPLQSWPIALITSITGDCSLWATRLPSVLATILTTLLIYGCGRQFLSRQGAFAAGLVYSSTGMVLQLGRLAETDALFTLLVSASLLVWHWGYARNSRSSYTWIAGYGLAALAALAKGPQAPVYFVAVTATYLCWRRDWRMLFNRSHLYGLGMFAAIVGAWQIPFCMQLGFSAAVQVWTGDVGMRFEDTRLAVVGLHLLLYPVETLICTLPWSPLLSAYAFRCFRDTIRGAKSWVNFLIVSVLVTFPTCWMVPGAKGRYWMPLYPCLALLTGLVIQRVPRAERHGTAAPRMDNVSRRGGRGRVVHGIDRRRSDLDRRVSFNATRAARLVRGPVHGRGDRDIHGFDFWREFASRKQGA